MFSHVFIGNDDVERALACDGACFRDPHGSQPCVACHAAGEAVPVAGAGDPPATRGSPR